MGAMDELHWTYIENPKGTLSTLVNRLRDPACTSCLIIGPSGCGKSTLIAAAMRECPCTVRKWSVDQHVDHLKPTHGSVAKYFARPGQPTVIIVEDVDIAVAHCRGLHIQLAQLITSLRATSTSNRLNVKYLLTAANASSCDGKTFKSLVNAVQNEDVLRITHATPCTINAHLAANYSSVFSDAHVDVAEFARQRHHNLHNIQQSLHSLRRESHIIAFSASNHDDDGDGVITRVLSQEERGNMSRTHKQVVSTVCDAQCCAALLADAGEDRMADALTGLAARLV